LGFLYFAGNGVAPDFREALKWYLKAAEGGNADAQFQVGFLLGSPVYGIMDMVQAIKWLRKAAVQGHQKASQLLEHSKEPIYEDTDDPHRDLRTAARFLDAKASYLLGLMYENGSDGVPQDLITAYKHLRLAEVHHTMLQRVGSPNSLEAKLPNLIQGALDRVKSQLTPEQIARAERELLDTNATSA
jgi:hypothetical protein